MYCGPAILIEQACGRRQLPPLPQILGDDLLTVTFQGAPLEAELAKIDLHGNRTDEDIATLANLD
jgi:hypothetical protein